MIVIGDSIAAQWWAAIDGAARRAGWRITWMTKTACPAADVTVRSQGVRYTACDTWRRNVLTKIRGFARADLVVMAGSSSSTLIRRSDGAVITDPAAAATEWGAGYRRSIDRLAGVARRVVILRDTPVVRVVDPELRRGTLRLDVAVLSRALGGLLGVALGGGDGGRRRVSMGPGDRPR